MGLVAGKAQLVGGGGVTSFLNNGERENQGKTNIDGSGAGRLGMSIYSPPYLGTKPLVTYVLLVPVIIGQRKFLFC